MTNFFSVISKTFRSVTEKWLRFKLDTKHQEAVKYILCHWLIFFRLHKKVNANFRHVSKVLSISVGSLFQDVHFGTHCLILFASAESIKLLMFVIWCLLELFLIILWFSWCCGRNARAASAQSFTLWQQATIEITGRDHSIIACSRHRYVGVILRAHPVRGESHIQRHANPEASTMVCEIAM